LPKGAGDATEHGEFLKTIGENHDMVFGGWATVERPARVELQDVVDVTPCG
jgi:hypothetical protein